MNVPTFRSLVVHLALAAAALLGLGAIGWVVVDSVIMPRVARSGWPVVSVPDMTGLPWETAAARLSALGLEPVVDPQRRRDDRVGPDQVALQAPAPGDSVKKGHVVRLWLSAGPTTVPVPDLSGQDSSEAAVHVQEAGLVLSDLDWTTSAKVPAGKVVRTEPISGTLLVRGGSVKLVVSSGTDPDSSRTDTDAAKPAQAAPRTF